MRAWEKTPLREIRKKPCSRRSLRTLQMQVRNRIQGSRPIRDTFPLHFLLPIKLSRVILTRSQWRPEENLLNLKVFLSSPLGRARFFPNLSSRAITRDFSQALIIDFSKKLENCKIFGGVSNLVFIVLWENSSERGEEKLDVSQWENLQIRKVFSRASLRTGLNDARELDFEKGMRWEGVSGVCSSLRFECALDFEGVGVTSSSQVFPHLFLRRQWSFLWDIHQWFFKFLVIFKVRVISSVYCSMSWTPTVSPPQCGLCWF